MKRIHVQIKPNNKHLESVDQTPDGEYIVHTKSPAVQGQANEAAVKLIAKHFGIAKSKVTLVRGMTSKFKVFDVAD